MVDRDATNQTPTAPPLSGERRSETRLEFAAEEAQSGEVPRAADEMSASPELPAFTSVAMVAVHEISNVLGWLDMTLEIVERAEAARARGDQVPPADVSAQLRDMRLGVRHMSAIVHELRSFGRPVDRSDESFDPRQALDTAVRFTAARIARRAQLVQLVGPTPSVRGSLHELTCVFLNLLLNAVDAIDEGSPNANVISVRASADDLGRAVFEVEDTGRGIAPKVGQHIFDPYFTGRADKGGTGLGLHVSQRIVKAMGGEVGFESAPGLGSLFRVVLPAAR